jgi:glycerophosphoryl diester phosphodiesterase
LRVARAILCAAAIAACSVIVTAKPDRSAPLLVAHRGASAYAPEHTRESYELAIAQGADYVEQDLQVTKDGVLVCLHDPTLERTTNVEDVFPDRSTAVNGRARWYVNDFTLEEIKRLDAGSWFNPKFAGARVPTWAEAMEIVGSRAGLFPELKDAALYRERGIDVAALFVAAAAPMKLTPARKGALPPLIVQSFDEDTLRTLSERLPAVPRILLLQPPDGIETLAPEGLKRVATFATGLGPAKVYVENEPALVRRIHLAGLTVIPYTFRSKSVGGRYASVRDEMAAYLFDVGVDGLFTDNPDLFPRADFR